MYSDATLLTCCVLLFNFNFNFTKFVSLNTHDERVGHRHLKKTVLLEGLTECQFLPSSALEHSKELARQTRRGDTVSSISMDHAQDTKNSTKRLGVNLGQITCTNSCISSLCDCQLPMTWGLGRPKDWLAISHAPPEQVYHIVESVHCILGFDSMYGDIITTFESRTSL